MGSNVVRDAEWLVVIALLVILIVGAMTGRIDLTTTVNQAITMTGF